MDLSHKASKEKFIRKYREYAEKGHSLESLAAELGLSLDSMRHHLRRLRSTGEILPYKSYLSEKTVSSSQGHPTDSIEIDASDEQVTVTADLTDEDTIIEVLNNGVVGYERFDLTKYTKGFKHYYFKNPVTGDIEQKTAHHLRAVFEKQNDRLVVEDLWDSYLDKLEKKSTKATAPKVKPYNSGNMLLIGLSDFHLGNLVWSGESFEDWDVGIAREVYREYFSRLLESAFARYEIDSVLLMLGSDFLHADGPSAQTSSGTQLALDSRWAKLYETALDLWEWSIDLCRERCSKVTVLVIPGNHDEQSCFTLGSAVTRIYRGCDDVTIDNEARSRKYFRHGATIIGLSHGVYENRRQLPVLFEAEANREDLAAAEYKEFFLGHIHHRKSQVLVETMEDAVGLTIRTLPSLTPADKYHTTRGYVSNVKTSEAYIYNDKDGLIGTVISNRPLGLKSK